MKLGWRAALGILLSAALLWWLLRDVPFATIMGHVRGANAGLLLLSGVVATCIFPLRALRWSVILDPVAPRLPFGVLFRPVTIGMMVSNVVPGRAGELARPYALTRETSRVPFTAAVASVAVDRVFDAAILLTLMFAAMLDPRFAPDAKIADRPIAEFAQRGLLGAGIVWAALLMLVFFPAPFLAAARRMAGWISSRFAERVDYWLRSFVQGLSVLRSPGRFLSVSWWTLLHWLVNALSYWIAFKAFSMDAPFSAALFIQAVIAIGVALPQAPGYWGGFELLAAAGLAVYGVPRELALAWGFAYHFVSFIPITVLGAVHFGRLGMHFGDLKDKPPAPPPSGAAA